MTADACRRDSRQTSPGQARNTPGPFVLVKTLREGDSVSEVMLGVFETKAHARERMESDYQSSIERWPDGYHAMKDSLAYAFDNDMCNWTAWHHWDIFDETEGPSPSWF